MKRFAFALALIAGLLLPKLAVAQYAPVNRTRTVLTDANSPLLLNGVALNAAAGTRTLVFRPQRHAKALISTTWITRLRPTDRDFRV